MSDKNKKSRLTLEEGLIAIWPIIFDSPETMSRLIEATSKIHREGRNFGPRVKSFAVLPAGASADELEDLLAEIDDELFPIR